MTQLKRPNWGGLPASLRTAGVCLLLPLLVATCGDDGPSGPSGPPMVGRIEFTSGPLLSGGFFGPNLPIDRVHVGILRPPSGDVVKDTTRSFDPNQNQLRLDLPILLRTAAESLDVTLELLSGTTILFSGTSRLEARAGPPSSTPPPAIPLIYSGPGSQIAQLLLAPSDSTLGQGDSLIMRVTGFDGSQQPVPSFYVGWSSSDTTIAQVNGAGVVRGRVTRGTVFIRAKTPDTQAFPTGIVESTTVSLVPDPTTIIKVSGDNQSAAAGASLPQPLVVEVRAGDNLPVPGVAVTFATADPGASVDNPTVITDASGLAATGAVLGSVPGAQSFTASVTGLATVTFAATATSVPTPTWTGAISTDWGTPGNWSTGAVPTFSDSVEIPAGGNQPVLTTNSVTGALHLANGTLTVNGQSLVVTGNFYSTGSGRLVMTNPSDGVSIGGNATFDGASQLGFMSDGALILNGDLTQLATNSPDSYHPSGAHATFFSGINQTISFATPGLVPGSSHLQEVIWNGTGNLTFASTVNAHGSFTKASSGNGTIGGSGVVMAVGGFSSALGTITFDNVTLVIDQATPTILNVNNLTFINQSPTATQLEVSHPGDGSTATFTNLTFSTVPTTGFYLSAVDVNPGNGLPFTIDMVNPIPATPGTFVQASGGAVVNWPVTPGGTATWTGAVSTDWSNAGNWTPAGVPGPGHDVVIGSAANQPALSVNVSAQSLTISGTGANLTLNGHSLTLTSDLLVSGVGTLTMTNPADQLIAGGNVTFQGADETGLLTAGVLEVQGNFVQTFGPTLNSFVASGTHQTRFTGSGAQSITFSAPTSSHFQDLVLANGGGITLSTLVEALGAVAVTAPVSVTGGSLTAGSLITVAGSTLGVGTLTMNSDQLTVGGSYTVPSTLFTGGAAVPVLPYQDLTLSSPTPMTLAGATAVSGNMSIDEGTLSVNGQTLTVGGSLLVTSTGTLTMTNPADQLIAGGNVTFRGQDETGLLTAGVLEVQGNFVQTFGPTLNSFVASGTHQTRFTGSGAQSITFSAPTSSHFQDLVVTQAVGGITLSTGISVNGSFISQPGVAAAPKITGGGNALTVVSLNVNKLILDNAPIIVNEQGTARSQQFDNVIFQGFPTGPTSVILMDLTMVGTAVTPRPVTFTVPTLQTSLGTGGLYARLVSSNTQFVTVTISGSNDPTGGPSRSDPSFGSTVNGARIVWQ